MDHAQSNKEGELLQSMGQLSLSASPPAPMAQSPKMLSKPGIARSPASPVPSSPQRNSSNDAKALHESASRPPTPTLLRTTSMGSMHCTNVLTPSRRASLTILMANQTATARSALWNLSPEPMTERPPPLTAKSIARAHFQAEMAMHQDPDVPPTGTIVVLQDACYGHRFARPRPSRATLGSIVERPERLKASALGVAAAYVRLGERHAEGAFAPHPSRLVDAGAGTVALRTPLLRPFGIVKTTRRLPLSHQTVTNVHGTRWMEELKTMCDDAETKLAMHGKELQRPDLDRGSNAEPPRKFHEGDLYLCNESLEALEGSLGGLCDAIDAVFGPRGPRRAFVAIRPPGHHCSRSWPSGFCWVNNIHVGIMHAILSHGLTHAAIIDFDLHHGDGSQAIAWEHNARANSLAKNAAWWRKSSIGYFSLHDINSYPCEMGDDDKVKNASLCIEQAHGQNIWNVHLQPWKTEAEFWDMYQNRYSVLLQKCRAYLKEQTELVRKSSLASRAAIFFSAGFDASEWESEGMQRHKVNVPTDFYARLSLDVVRLAAEEGTSVEGRVISVLEGGYSDRALCSGVFSHLSGLAGDDAVESKELDLARLSQGVRREVSSAGAMHSRKDSPARKRGAWPYESSWWSSAQLDALENVVRNDTPEQQAKKPRNTTPPAYCSPTASSTAKMAESAKMRRAMPGLPSGDSGSPLAVARAPTPAAPEVQWTIAAHELSKLLIPSNRQTDSYKHEHLNAEATRARRERQSAFVQPVPTVPERIPMRMSLRERKPKPMLYLDEDDEDDAPRTPRKAATVVPDRPPLRAADKSPAKQASRRPTEASTTAAKLFTEGTCSRASEKPPDRQARRRPSAASTVVSGVLETETPLPCLATSAVFSRTETMGIRGGPATTTPALNMKKVRGHAKKGPVPKAPRMKKTASTSGAVPGSNNTGGTATFSQATKASDMDELANHVKTIKITLLTKEQKEARLLEKAKLRAALERHFAPEDPTLSCVPLQRFENARLSGTTVEEQQQESMANPVTEMEHPSPLAFGPNFSAPGVREPPSHTAYGGSNVTLSSEHDMTILQSKPQHPKIGEGFHHIPHSGSVNKTAQL